MDGSKDNVDGTRGGMLDGWKQSGLSNVNSHCSLAEMDGYDMSKLKTKSKLNSERQRSYDERSLSELTSGLSKCLEGYEYAYSPGRASAYSPACSASCEWTSFEPHPIFVDAWESLRRCLVNFRGQPVGTIAACDHASEEVLNYDQVNLRINIKIV